VKEIEKKMQSKTKIIRGVEGKSKHSSSLGLSLSQRGGGAKVGKSGDVFTREAGEGGGGENKGNRSPQTHGKPVSLREQLTHNSVKGV